MILLIYMPFSNVEVYETSADGNKLSKINTAKKSEFASPLSIELLPSETYQTITGIGGSFTESSAYLLSLLSTDLQQDIINQYFGTNGAMYSLTRTHINSCDFSLNHYSFADEEQDGSLSNFTIDHDKQYLIPMIKSAMNASEEGFQIIASPWTAPPWMKDNKQWVGGKLSRSHEKTWATYIAKYINAYAEQEIPIWGITVENEPLGNDNNWESMHFTPFEMNRFVLEHLRPTLGQQVQAPIKILGFDQNRDALEEWVNAMYSNATTSDCYDGVAIHWYASTYKIFSKALQYAHHKAQDKHIIQTEGCIDAQVPVWKNDDWYWSANATDWGWTWASEDNKYLHRKYVPVFRYAQDIIGCINNWVDGWIDWNMVLNRQGGPNWAKNWCIAPVIVDELQNEVYYTPLYYAIAHFSKFIRPGDERIGISYKESTLEATAIKNSKGGFVVVVLNQEDKEKTYTLRVKEDSMNVTISRKALQTIEISI